MKLYMSLILLYMHIYIYILQVYAWVGFVLSVIWIYVIANEIVNLLQVILC